MKKLLLILLCLPIIGFGQSVPQGINYQAVARDASGEVLSNDTLTIKFSVLNFSTSYGPSAVSWQETHTVTTNDYGLYTAIIGQGTSTSVGSSATFDVIDWGAHHLLKVEVDYGGGLVDMGTTAFMSVPYSMNANNVNRKNGEALVQTFYVTFDTSQDFKVNQKPLFDDGIVRFGWDAPGNDIEFYLIPGSEPSGINPANGQPWGIIPAPGTGFPASQLQANVWNNDSFLPSTSTFISPGVAYDLMPTGVFALERGSGTISPYYDQANPHKSPNFFGFNNTNDYVGERPPFPTYNFTYHNLGSSSNTTLQITKISN